MDHNLSWRGLILVLQKPNINFTIEATTSMKNTSSKFPLFPNRKPVPNSGHKQLNSLSYDSPGNEIDHKATTSMKNTSLNSLRFPTENQSRNSGHKQLNSLSCDSLENEMDHNLSCRGQIWVIQKSNIKFTIAATISMKNTSQNSLCFPTKNQSQILDYV